ncbi:hypothetical protein JCM33374_g4721 [Metschnikowia sp. JCM 33374]|nr:hypothetical protein JCM33374_g4721 [Metschnikowia sp. JCM 33374]
MLREHFDQKAQRLKVLQIFAIMLPWILLLLFTVGLTYDTNHVGSMYISKMGNESVEINLRVYGNRLYISDQRSGFEYDVRGIVWLSKTTRFLSVGEHGRLKLIHRPQTGFLLKKQPGYNFRRTLSFNGVDEFELCGDYSIRYKSNCWGALAIKITFKDRFR